MRFFAVLISAIFLFFASNSAMAQYASQNKAKNMATLYAVLNVKMKDADIQKDLDSLRQNQTFIENLQKKLDKLSNNKNSDAKNRKVRDILEKAGKDLDSLL